MAARKLEEKDIARLLAQGETFHLECKKAKGGLPSSLWESYSSFSNTEGGVIILGVKETDAHKFEVCGVDDADKLIKDFWVTVKNKSKVNACVLTNADVYPCDYGGRTIVVINVPRASRELRPIYLNGDMFTGTYVRLHEGDFKCEGHVVRRMVADQFDTCDNMICRNCTFDADIDHSVFSAYRQAFKNERPGHPFLNSSDFDLFREIGGYGVDNEAGEEGVTLAGLLMFGKLQSILRQCPNYIVDYREYPASVGVLERWIDRLTTDFMWPGNLFSFYRHVILKLYPTLKTPFALSRDMIRIDDTPAHVAVREAVVNTLIHADYGGRMAIRVFKYPDRFEFINPGLMRMSQERAFAGGNSDCRNRGLQKMFQLLGISEQAGSGFPKIFLGCDSQHWPRPTVHEDFELNQTTLTLKIEDINAANENLNDIAADLKNDLKNDLEIFIINSVAKDHETTYSCLARDAGLSVPTIQRAIRELKRRGVLIRVGGKRGGHWEVIG